MKCSKKLLNSSDIKIKITIESSETAIQKMAVSFFSVTSSQFVNFL